jgi:hypothetical protein
MRAARSTPPKRGRDSVCGASLKPGRFGTGPRNQANASWQGILYMIYDSGVFTRSPSGASPAPPRKVAQPSSGFKGTWDGVL